jgi:L-lactate dehydrogenase complex protein LldG
MSAREEMLARIRAALGPDPATPAVPRGYRLAGSEVPASPEMVERFCDRATAYRATVRRASPPTVEAAVAAACAERGSRRLAAAPGASWSPPDLEVTRDGPEHDVRSLDRIDAALTGCALAVAETGTIALDGDSLCGRRALTLIPDHHICVVRTDQIVANLPEAIAALAAAAQASRPVTLISGPSATSDIELERVEGVHGPRRLDIVVVECG